MKKRLLLMAPLVLAGLWVPAEEAATNGAASGVIPAGFHRNGPGNEGEHVEKWLDVLKQRNPEEFEKMRKLREENPEEFRKTLHQKLQDFRTKNGGNLRDKPQIMKALHDLSPEDRDWVMQRLQQGGGPMGFGGPDNRRGFPDFRHVMTPEIEQGERKGRELAKKLHEAKTDDEKSSLRKELRDQIAAVFDLREKQRGEMVRMIDEKVTKLRQQLDDRKNRRDQLIDEELQNAVNGPPVLPPK